MNERQLAYIKELCLKKETTKNTLENKIIKRKENIEGWGDGVEEEKEDIYEACKLCIRSTIWSKCFGSLYRLNGSMTAASHKERAEHKAGCGSAHLQPSSQDKD